MLSRVDPFTHISRDVDVCSFNECSLVTRVCLNSHWYNIIGRSGHSKKKDFVMEFVPLISTCKCIMCGDISSCARLDGDVHVCRSCNPEGWEKAANLEKENWLTGGMEATDA